MLFSKTTSAEKAPTIESGGSTHLLQRKASRSEAPAAVPPIVHQVLAQSGQRLDSATRSFMELRLGHDFSHVRIHRDAQAAASAEAIGAEAYTAGTHVVLGRGAKSGGSAQERAVLAHELTHVAQHGLITRAPSTWSGIAPSSSEAERTATQAESRILAGDSVHLTPVRADASRLQLLPTSLSGIPDSERRAMRVGTISVTVPQAEIDAVFATTGARTSYSHGGQTTFGTGIDPALQRGLTSIGAWITNQTNALPLNSTIEVVLDLTRHGGANSVYRFSWFAHTEQQTTTNVMLVELVGPATAASNAPVPSGSFTVGGQSFRLGGTWSESEFGQLQHALGLMPAAALTGAAGVTFRRRSGNGPGTEAGEYDQSTDTITLFDNAFATDSLRYGSATAGERNILHEIGHAIDLRVLERAWTTFNAGGQTAAGRQTLLGTRSLSGSRWKQGTGGDYNVDPAHGATDGAFRTAVRADGVRRDTSGRTTSMGSTAQLSGGVTEYSDTDYGELFAESYALYFSNPTVLQQLRPQTYAYFRRRYP